jgi:hypothetical protein
MSRTPHRPENGLLWEVPGDDPQLASTGATPANRDLRIAALLQEAVQLVEEGQE